jgi:hypothetical protein
LILAKSALRMTVTTDQQGREARSMTDRPTREKGQGLIGLPGAPVSR